jgi:hypothetical protein
MSRNSVHLEIGANPPTIIPVHTILPTVSLSVFDIHGPFLDGMGFSSQIFTAINEFVGL